MTKPLMAMEHTSGIAWFTLPGLAIGLAAGLSETEGTAKKAIVAFGGLLGSGGIIALAQVSEVVVIAISFLSAGFIIGILLGAILRVKTSLSIKWV